MPGISALGRQTGSGVQDLHHIQLVLGQLELHETLSPEKGVRSKEKASKTKLGKQKRPAVIGHILENFKGAHSLVWTQHGGEEGRAEASTMVDKKQREQYTTRSHSKIQSSRTYFLQPVPTFCLPPPPEIPS